LEILVNARPKRAKKKGSAPTSELKIAQENAILNLYIKKGEGEEMPRMWALSAKDAWVVD